MAGSSAARKGSHTRPSPGLLEFGQQPLAFLGLLRHQPSMPSRTSKQCSCCVLHRHLHPGHLNFTSSAAKTLFPTVATFVGIRWLVRFSTSLRGAHLNNTNCGGLYGPGSHPDSGTVWERVKCVSVLEKGYYGGWEESPPLFLPAIADQMCSQLACLPLCFGPWSQPGTKANPQLIVFSYKLSWAWSLFTVTAIQQ